MLTNEIASFVGSEAWTVAVVDVIDKLEHHALSIAVALRQQRALSAKDSSGDDDGDGDDDDDDDDDVDGDCAPYLSTDAAHVSISVSGLRAAANDALDKVATGQRTAEQNEALVTLCLVNRYALLPPVGALLSMQRSVRSLPTSKERLMAAVWRAIVLVVIGSENADNVVALCDAAPAAKKKRKTRRPGKGKVPEEVVPLVAALRHLVSTTSPLPVAAVPRRFATKTPVQLLACVVPLTAGTAPSFHPGLATICAALESSKRVAHGREALHSFQQNLKSIGWWMCWKIVGMVVGLLDETERSEMVFRLTSRMEPVQGAKSRVWCTAAGIATEPGTGQVDCEDFMAPHLAQLIACCLRDGDSIEQGVFADDCGVYARGRAIFVLIENSMCELSREVKTTGHGDAGESKEGENSRGEGAKKNKKKKEKAKRTSMDTGAAAGAARAAAKGKRGGKGKGKGGK
jgi:hypothetical protein